MEASSHRPTAGIHADEGQTTSTSWRKCPGPTKGMGTKSTTLKPKCNGHICYDHALLVTGYDVLLSTLQGNLSFSTSSVSFFASTHARPDYFSFIDHSPTSRHSYRTHALKPHHVHCLTDSLVPCYLHPFPLDVIMTYDSDPDSDPILSYDIIAYRFLYDKTIALDPDHTYSHSLLAHSPCMMDISPYL